MQRKKLTFADALKSTKPTAFATIIKPLGAACNMRCKYCYYLDKELQYTAKPKLISDTLLEEYTAQYIQANSVEQVDFCWHGGEPLLAGVDFYRKAVELQHKYKGEKKITNSLQTNGLLLTDEFCQFFAEHNFLIGISIDGPESLHNATRLATTGEPTFDKVIQGIEKLHRFGVEFNTLSAVSSFSEGRGVETYRFLKSIGSHFMQFLPVAEFRKDGVVVAPEANGECAEWSVSALGFGRFMKDIFQEWVVQDVGRYYVQLFDATLANWCGVQAGVCSLCEVCGDGLVVEHNGDVYSCDHFVYPEYRLGNINTDNLKTMFSSAQQFGFGVNKRNNLPEVCQRCEWLHLCHGECPKHRFEDGQNILCTGLQSFFKYSKPYMEYMKGCIEQQREPAEVMLYARHRMGF